MESVQWFQQQIRSPSWAIVVAKQWRLWTNTGWSSVESRRTLLYTELCAKLWGLLWAVAKYPGVFYVLAVRCMLTTDLWQWVLTGSVKVYSTGTTPCLITHAGYLIAKHCCLCRLSPRIKWQLNRRSQANSSVNYVTWALAVPRRMWPLSLWP